MRAHPGRGEHLAAVGRGRRQRGHAEAVGDPEIGEQGGVAAAPGAKHEVVADHHMGRLQPLAQHLDHEGFGALAGQLGVEMQYEQVVDADRLEMADPDAERRQAEGRLARREELARMRLEGEHRQAGAELAGAARRGADHRLMAAMHAVEIAERHHRAARLDRYLGVMSKQPHGDPVVPPACAAQPPAGLPWRPPGRPAPGARGAGEPPAPARRHARKAADFIGWGRRWVGRCRRPGATRPPP